MGGYFKIFYSMRDWQWKGSPNTVALWIDILLNTNYADGYSYGVPVKRGQCITGIKKLSQSTGLSMSATRLALNRLKATNEIAIKTTNKYTIITVINWEKYQCLEKKATNKTTSKTTNEQQTNNKQTTTNEEEEEEQEYKEKDLDILSGSSNSDCTASADQVIDWLNERTGSHYRHSDTSRRHIVARLKEGYSIQDCGEVIDKKCVEWMNDPKMQKFLRPETLFGSKFENYLNQQIVRKESYLQRVIREEEEKENEQKGNSKDSGDTGFELPDFKYPER